MGNDMVPLFVRRRLVNGLAILQQRLSVRGTWRVKNSPASSGAFRTYSNRKSVCSFCVKEPLAILLVVRAGSQRDLHQVGLLRKGLQFVCV